MKKYIMTLLWIINLQIYSQVPINLQEKLTNLNSFSNIDIGVGTNQIATTFEVNDLTNSRDTMMILANKKFGDVSLNLYKNFFWNTINLVTDNYRVFLISYGFGENLMDFEDKITVRSQMHYEKKLPLVLKYLYSKHGTNYQIVKISKGAYEDKKNMIDPMIYWEKSDGKIYFILD